MAALRWDHQYGRFLDGWLKIHNDGGEAPRHFYERPDLPEHLWTYRIAFGDLSSERPIGMALGQIPLSAVKRYVSEDMGLEGEAGDFAVDLLRTLDARYLAMLNEKPGKVKPGDVKGVSALLGRAANRAPTDKRKRKSL